MVIINVNMSDNCHKWILCSALDYSCTWWTALYCQQFSYCLAFYFLLFCPILTVKSWNQWTVTFILELEKKRDKVVSLLKYIFISFPCRSYLSWVKLLEIKAGVFLKNLSRCSHYRNSSVAYSQERDSELKGKIEPQSLFPTKVNY